MDIIKFIKQHYNTNLNSFHRRFPEEVKVIKKETKFLDTQKCTLKQRMYHILHDIKTYPNCVECGIPITKWNVGQHKYRDFCSTKCSNSSKTTQLKKNQTCFKNHGVEHPLQSKVIHDKVKKTNLKKYGVENPSQSEQIKRTKIRTNLKKWGVDNPNKHNIIKDKIRKTINQKYDVDCYFQADEFNVKRKQSMLKKYNVEHPLQHKDIRKKQKRTCLLRYGVEYPYQNKNIRNKVIFSNKIKFNRESNSQQHISLNVLELLNSYEWLILQHHIMNKTLTQIAYELNVDGTTVSSYCNKNNIVIKYYSNQSFKCIQWLKYMEEVDQTSLIEEYRIPTTQYKADGYDPLTNTLYEFYGDFWHGNPHTTKSTELNTKTNTTYQELYDKTIHRELKLKKLGYDLVTIWESEWDSLNKKTT